MHNLGLPTLWNLCIFQENFHFIYLHFPTSPNYSFPPLPHSTHNKSNLPSPVVTSSHTLKTGEQQYYCYKMDKKSWLKLRPAHSMPSGVPSTLTLVHSCTLYIFVKIAAVQRKPALNHRQWSWHYRDVDFWHRCPAVRLFSPLSDSLFDISAQRYNIILERCLAFQHSLFSCLVCQVS